MAAPTGGAARFGQVATTPRSAAGATGKTVAAPRKYTVLLDATRADAFDQLLLVIRRRTGKRVDKSHVVRELLALLDEDPALLGELVERLSG